VAREETSPCLVDYSITLVYFLGKFRGYLRFIVWVLTQKKKAFETKIKIISVTTAATTTPRSGFYFNIGEKEVQCEPPADNLQFGANTD
jgi:hypothetical protein